MRFARILEYIFFFCWPSCRIERTEPPAWRNKSPGRPCSICRKYRECSCKNTSAAVRGLMIWVRTGNCEHSTSTFCETPLHSIQAVKTPLCNNVTLIGSSIKVDGENSNKSYTEGRSHFWSWTIFYINYFHLYFAQWLFHLSLRLIC